MKLLQRIDVEVRTGIVTILSASSDSKASTVDLAALMVFKVIRSIYIN